jgi:predicted alpha/beta superfamily hydrolase
MSSAFPKILSVIVIACLFFSKDATAQTELSKSQLNSSKKGIVTFYPDILQPAFSKIKRGIWVYIPPGYNATSAKQYPVLYMHDGQNLFDARTSYAGEWGIDELMDSLIEKGLPPSIVVGINNSAERIREYKPFDSEKYGESLADEYLEFIAKDLKRYIDSAYKTKPDALNTIIAGSSMGGLVTYYAALKYQNVFGKAGFFSTSFWIEPSLIDLLPASNFSTSNKYFFYMGELEGEENVQINENFADKMALMGNAVIYATTSAEGEHNEKSWAKTFPLFYKWITASGPNVILSTD